MTTIERLRAIIDNKSNELALIDVATNLGFRFPKSVSNETWEGRENYDTFLRNLISQYEIAELPPMRGESPFIVRANKQAKDARTFLKHSFPEVNTPEKLLVMFLERGVTE